MTLALAKVDQAQLGPLAGFRNHIINGAMMVSQRATSFVAGANNDDTYNLDRWIILSDGNDIVDITRATDAPTGGLNSIGLDVETVNKKFGILQIIEQRNCIGLIGQTVTLSFKARVSSVTKLDNLKFALLAWDGTADAVTSDVVFAWNAEDVYPTLVANWTYEAANEVVPTTGWVTYSVTGIIDQASTKNIAVFIWSDVTDTTLGNFLYVTDVQLEQGSVATTFERRPYQTELELCSRYCQVIHAEYHGPATGGAGCGGCVVFKPPMFGTPTIADTNLVSTNAPAPTVYSGTSAEFTAYYRSATSTANTQWRSRGLCTAEM
jgi:hypothetical protein